MVKTAPNSPLNFAMISSAPIFFFFVFFISTIFPSSSSSPVSISLSPNILTKSGNSVRVQWTGIDSPSNLDWLGIYSPPDSSDENFIGYVFLSSCENWQSGSCSIDLPLVNLRSNYEFRIFRWTEKEVDRSRLDQDHNPLPGTKHLLGKSEKLGFESGRGPEQIHLAFTTKDDEMRVMFITADGKENFVKYGDRKDGMDKVVGTEVTTYKRSEMCDSPANESIGWRDPGFIYDGVLRNLKRGRRYYYKVEWAAIQHVSSRRILGSIHGLGDIYSHPPQLLHCSIRSAFDLKSISLERPINGWIAVLDVLVTADAKVGSDGGGWSETHSFVSRDWASDETIAFLFGDMGTSTPYSTFLRTQEESKSTIKWIIRDIKALGDKPAFISHIGDISYARGFSWLWDTFFTQIEPVASKVPYHVCIGNHEYDWPLQPWKPDWAQTVYKMDGGGECGVPYSLKFNMPGNSSAPTGTSAPATRNLFYSFDAGVVHFMYMSTETNFLPGSDQYNFIKHDLETIDRKKTPFVVVQGHRPMYTTSNEFRDAPLRERLLEHYEPLFVKNKVTLALWGHVHRYERFCPMKNFTCGGKNHNREDGEHLPVHAVIGMGGQDWQPIWEPRPDHPKDPIFPQPDCSLYRGGEFGYTRLLATKEKLTLSYVGNHDGEVHDVVEIPAPGRVLNSGGSSGSVVVESTLSLYVKGGSVLVLGAFLGYVIGFISRARKEAALRKNWIPVKSEET